MDIGCQDGWLTQYGIEYLAGNTVSEFKAGRITRILRGPNNEPRNLQINVVICERGGWMGLLRGMSGWGD